MARDHADKVPELIAAAERAQDTDTALHLLRKAKSLDPSCVDVYRRIAELLGDRGDQDGMLQELRAILGVDPLHWETRFTLLSLEHPRHPKLAHAGGIVADLAWERGYPLGWLNVSRGELRSDSELGYDQSVLAHLGLLHTGAYGVVELVAVHAAPGGAFAVLNAGEPWLQVFEADGRLRFGVDLWVEAEGQPVVCPADVAVDAEGVIWLCDPLGARLLRYSADTGAALGALALASRVAPVGVACSPSGAVVVLASDGSVYAYDPRGRAVGRRKHPRDAGVSLRGDAAGWGLAVDRRGEAHVTDGHTVVSLGRRGRRARVVRVPGGAGRPRRGERAGLDVGDGGRTFAVARPGRSSVAIFGEDGTLEVDIKETACGPLSRPRDVCDIDGTAVVIDTGHARVLALRDGDARVVFGGVPGWRSS